MTLVCFLSSSPTVDVGMSSQELSSDSISLGMRVDEASLQNDWFQVFVNIRDYTRFVLLNLFKFQVLRQVKNLSAIKRQGYEEVCLHLLSINSYKDVWFFQVPKYAFCTC